MRTLIRILIDSALALGLVAALSIVFHLDKPKPLEEGEEWVVDDASTETILSTGKMYARRTAKQRDKWIGKFGGSPISEKAVHDGLDWLARHQSKDGSWSNHSLGRAPGSRCERPNVCTGPGRDYAMAQTGLTLLAFLAGGHYDFNGSEYSDNVRSGLDWIVANQNKDGEFAHSMRDDSRFMYEHGIATFAVAEACAVAKSLKNAPDPRYLDAATRAIRFIEQQQHKDGGWRYSKIPAEEGDTSVSGWQILALKTAKEAGIKVDPEVVARAEKFFETCEMKENGRTAYQRIGGQVSEATTGVGMLVHQFLLGTPDSRLVKEAAAHLADVAEKNWAGKSRGSPDYYLWYNCTMAMFQAGGPEWERWNKVVRDTVIALQEQNKKSCERGSWAPDDRWGPTGGRIYSTSLAVLTLEVYYRFSNSRAK